MIYTGIDWSDSFHDFCILNEAGEKIESFSMAHGPDGFEAAHKRMAKHANPDQMRVAIETRDSLLVDFLLELGYTLYFLNAPENLAVLGKIALNLAKREASSKISIRRKLLRAGWDDSYVEKVLVS